MRITFWEGGGGAQGVCQQGGQRLSKQCTKAEQQGVSFATGYVAGAGVLIGGGGDWVHCLGLGQCGWGDRVGRRPVLCAALSHPADNLISKLPPAPQNTLIHPLPSPPIQTDPPPTPQVCSAPLFPTPPTTWFPS